MPKKICGTSLKFWPFYDNGCSKCLSDPRNHGTRRGYLHTMSVRSVARQRARIAATPPGAQQGFVCVHLQTTRSEAMVTNRVRDGVRSCDSALGVGVRKATRPSTHSKTAERACARGVQLCTLERLSEEVCKGRLFFPLLPVGRQESVLKCLKAGTFTLQFT